ncbi:DUF2332 family protein [Rhodococcus jostii]|uniref:DUF2332 family protein n=1 Tax=Rhodococcus jostii TaxID=132919 RepID=A0ABU4CTJ8_RHOJO|nr:DUF2332 family protein [Rhodococcus jostii]MDV6286903.1 DUF2332 family protein [Rhodococcus jostii]
MDTSLGYRTSADVEAKGNSATYEQWCTDIADDPDVIALIERLPEPRRQPNLVLGASRHLGAPDGSYASDIVNRRPPNDRRGFHSAVLNYLSPEARASFVATVQSLPCRWIANEGVGVLPEITAKLPTAPEQLPGKFVVSLDGEPKALAGSHGQSLDWAA